MEFTTDRGTTECPRSRHGIVSEVTLGFISAAKGPRLFSASTDKGALIFIRTNVEILYHLCDNKIDRNRNDIFYVVVVLFIRKLRLLRVTTHGIIQTSAYKTPT